MFLFQVPNFGSQSYLNGSLPKLWYGVYWLYIEDWCEPSAGVVCYDIDYIIKSNGFVFWVDLIGSNTI